MFCGGAIKLKCWTESRGCLLLVNGIHIFVNNINHLTKVQKRIKTIITTSLYIYLQNEREIDWQLSVFRGSFIYQDENKQRHFFILF